MQSMNTWDTGMGICSREMCGESLAPSQRKIGLDTRRKETNTPFLLLWMRSLQFPYCVQRKGTEMTLEWAVGVVAVEE